MLTVFVTWAGRQNLAPKKYQCAFCGAVVGSRRGFRGSGDRSIYTCTNCGEATYFRSPTNQIPRVPPGNDVQNLPNRVATLYREARECVAVSAYTAAVLTCRKLLMHVAVEQGAENGQRFVTYIDHLVDKGYVSSQSRKWVDHIRGRANEANHETELMEEKDANDLLTFVEMLLKLVFEYPGRITPVSVDPPWGS